MPAAEVKPVRFNWVIAVVCVLVAGFILFRFDPARTGFYPVCLFYRTTGWQCPGCGGLRATHQLLHGHLAEALRLNAWFVVFLLPVTCLLGLRWCLGRLRKRPLQVRPFWLWLGLAVTLAFGIGRNLL